jgi:mannosyltransferase OCH1-like enzyme
MIPKVIYMCDKTLQHIRIFSKNWKKLNPEYEIKLYNDEMCKEFLLKEYSQLHLDIFNFLKDGPIKSDFWRVCVIHKYGGLYVDADIEPIVPLRDYIKNKDNFITCLSFNFNPTQPKSQFNPHFLGAKKNDIHLYDCIQRYEQQYKNNVPYTYWGYSVCTLLEIKGVDQKLHEMNIDGKQFKFLYEKNKKCSYYGTVVFNNKYKMYKYHKFKGTRKKVKN